jgi:hypothetical protein
MNKYYETSATTFVTGKGWRGCKTNDAECIYIDKEHSNKHQNIF